MYAFFLDIDGTIYDGNRVAQEVADAIARARSAGHKVFINTARAYIGVPDEVLALPVDGFICSFGLEIFAEGKCIHRRFIPREQALEVANYAFQNGVSLYFEGETRLDLNRWRDDSLNPANLEEFRQMLGTSRVCKFSLPDGPTEADKHAFSEDFHFFDIEVIAKGYSKTRGIALVEEYFGLSRAEIVAVGDADSDLDMIQYAGIGVAMGNGSPRLKACADFVTKPIDQHGAAYAIDYLLTNKKADA